MCFLDLHMAYFHQNPNSSMKKQQRLSGKDIAYLLKKWTRLSWAYFFGYTLLQGARRQHHQRNVHISTKLDKRSAKRNYLKRYLNEQRGLCIGAVPFAKTFLMIHKQQYAVLQQLIATRNKKAIRELLNQRCSRDFSLFVQYVWRPSWNRSQPGTADFAKALKK